MKEVQTYPLNRQALRSLSKGFSRFVNAVQDNCFDYAFFRGEIFTTQDNNLGVIFIVGDPNARLSVVEFDYSPEENVLYLCNKLKFQNHKPIIDSFVNLISLIETMPIPVSRIYFEVVPGFIRGTYEEDPKEEGSKILYLFGKTQSIYHGISKGNVKGNIEADEGLFGERWRESNDSE